MGDTKFAALLGAVLLALVPACAAGKPQLGGIKLPPGFSISVYSDAVPGARSLAQSPRGIVYVGSMEAGKVYKVTLQPMTTSNYFAAGHRIRLEVSSSNFPRFDRNLNTGGKNYDETQGVVAHNAVHHSKQYPSEVKITVVKK